MRIGHAARELGLLLPPIFFFLLTGLAWAYAQRPYQDLVAHFTSPTGHLSITQRHNVVVAARYMDGAVIGRGGRFSFNDIVGPRTTARGFGEANAFMEGSRVRSLGGGVCQLSSTLYAALQETALPVVKRVPHVAIIASVPPGRDAAVWYGKSDLQFDNTFDRPLRVRAYVEGSIVRVELWGTAAPDQRVSLRFGYRYGRTANQKVVWVYRRIKGQNVLLSQDTYKLALR